MKGVLIAVGIRFDVRAIERLGVDDAMLKILKSNNIETIGDLQRALVNERRLYQVGEIRQAYLRAKLSERGLIARRPWTDRFHEKVFGASKRIHTLSVAGEKILADRLTKWLHDEAKIPRSNQRADPLYVFCARVGCGRIRRLNPGSFDRYAVYELRPGEDGRFDDVILGVNKVAGICGVDVPEVNRIYQDCLKYLRSKEVSAEIKRIFKEYGERRK